MLLQMILYEPQKGVQRDQLMEELFSDREILDTKHSLRVLLYNTRKRLREEGLPDCDYIEQKEDRYYWTKKIRVLQDAAEFENLHREAEALEKTDEKGSVYLKTCYRYTGEFLPMQAGSLWASRHF